MLSGYRTYIIAILMFIAGGLRAMNYIDENTYQMVMAALVPGGLIALRLGIKNS